MTQYFFLEVQSAFWLFKAITVSERCLIKLLPYILFEKHINISAVKMTSPGNRHCASCIGTLSFNIHASEATATWRFTNFVLYCIVL